MFKSQQEALRQAFTQVLGSVPVKGMLVISAEDREKVGELMMSWLSEGKWSIKDGTRAASFPREYVMGMQPTCLIQAWTLPRKKDKVATGGEVIVVDKIAQIKAAKDAGLISEEQAMQAVMKHLGIAS